MGKALRILHVFGQMQQGGAELRTLDLMRHLDRERYRLEFCTLSGLPGALDDSIRTLGGRIYPCRLGLGFPVRFRRLLRQERFDVVHSHVHYSSGYILRLASKEGVPVRVAHFRNTGDGRPETLLWTLRKRVLRHWIDRYASRILAVSEGAMRYAWRPDWRADARCCVIYNGLDVSRYRIPADPNGVRREFGFLEGIRLYINVARMDPQKNHVRLATIFASIAHRDPDARLAVVGRGGNAIERDFLARVKDLGISDRVVLTGVRNDIPRLLKSADLMIFPSTREGLPGAVLEACAAGTPVLGTSLPGLCEIATHFPSVRTLSLEVDDEAWADSAEEMREASHRDSESAERVARSAFGIETCARAFCSVWEGGS